MLVKEHKNGQFELSQEKIDEYKKEFLNAINDDLNMPVALAVVQKLLKEERSKDVYSLVMKFNEILGLNFEEQEAQTLIPQDIALLAQKRWQAKLDKNWQEADKLRNEILEKGYLIKDSKEGYKIEKV